jgi:hypothetical protein
MTTLPKLTKKEQAVLATLKHPYVDTDLVKNIDSISQNLLKYIYTDIENGVSLTEEEETITEPASVKKERTIVMVLGDSGPGTVYEENVAYPARTYQQKLTNLSFLRFNRGTAMVGAQIDNVLYVHAKFFDHFKTDKKIRIEEFVYRGPSSYGTFMGDDFPRIAVHELKEIRRAGDWVICE